MFGSISPQKQDQLRKRMEALKILESDLDETFIQGSGRGGQKINKTASTVSLHHRPTGIRIKCQKERSRAMNRFFARRLLCEKLEEQDGSTLSPRETKIQKLKKQKNRRYRRSSSQTKENDPPEN